MAQQRIHTLDALRGIAAASVAFFHFNEVRARGGSLYDAANRWGWLGVTVFFVLSGYCVQRATERERRPRDFLVRRFARIYPAYAFSLAVVVAFCIGRKLTTGTNDFIALPSTATAWLATLTLTTAPVGSVATINWVYWSLSYEIYFYLLLAVGLVWPSLRVAWLLAICAVALVPGASGKVFFLGNWGSFALGTSLALLGRQRTWQAASLFVAALAVMAMKQSVPEIVTAGATVALIAGATGIDAIGGKVLAGLARLGEVSYGLYLIHVPVGVWVMEKFADAHRWRELGLAAHLLCDGIALALSTLAAAAIYRWIEQPAIEWGRSRTMPRPLAEA